MHAPVMRSRDAPMDSSGAADPAARVRSLTFSTDPLRPAERFAAWRAFIPGFLVRPADGVPPERFSASVTGHHLEKALISRIQCGPQHADRPESLIRQDGGDTIMARLLLR